jgi:hypothetical protein
MYADAVIIGEAEGQWEKVIDDVRHDTLQTVYRQDSRPSLNLTRIDRSIFEGSTRDTDRGGTRLSFSLRVLRRAKLLWGNTDETTH